MRRVLRITSCSLEGEEMTGQDPKKTSEKPRQAGAFNAYERAANCTRKEEFIALPASGRVSSRTGSGIVKSRTGPHERPGPVPSGRPMGAQVALLRCPILPSAAVFYLRCCRGFHGGGRQIQKSAGDGG